MALVGFKAQFAQYVQEGSKTHTIRAWAADVGETLHCYTGLRGHGPARLLGRFECVRVEPISIYIPKSPVGVQVVVIRLDGRRLRVSESRLFAWDDGFRSQGLNRALYEMAAYYQNEKIERFHGWVNHWRFQA